MVEAIPRPATLVTALEQTVSDCSGTRKFPEKRGHLDRCDDGFETLVRVIITRSSEYLFFVLRGQHAKDHRYASGCSYFSNTHSGGLANDVVVRGLAADDDTNGNDGIKLTAASKLLAHQWQLE